MTERIQDKNIKKLENDVRYLLHVIASGGVTSTFAGLTDGPGPFTGNALEVIRVNAAETALEYTALAGGGDALKADPLSQFASTTSAQLAGIISNETGSGLLVFNTSPLFVTPRLNSTSTAGHVWTATDVSGNGSFQAIAANLLVDSSGSGEPIWTTSLDTLHFATINNAITEVDGSITISSGLFPTTGTGTATGNIIGDLDGNTLSVQQGGNSFLSIDPTAGNEISQLLAVNTTGADNFAYFQAATTNAQGQFSMSSSFNGTATEAFITGTSDASSSILAYSATTHTFTGAVTLVDLAGNGAGVVAIDNNGLLSWSAGGGSGTFVSLTDGPGAFATNSLKVVRVNVGETALEYVTLAGGGDALTANPLSQFAATTSAQFAGVISDETGTDKVVFNTSPLFVTPRLEATSTIGHVWTATDGSGNGSFQAIAGGGISTFNTLTGATQTLAMGTTAQSNDLGWVSSGTIHTLHVPDASATVRGVVTTGVQTFAGNKTLSGSTTQSGLIFTLGGIRSSSSTDQGNFFFPSANGASSSTAAQLLFGGASAIKYRVATRGTASNILAAGDSYANIVFGEQTVTEGTSGTHAVNANVVIKSQTIGNGSATTTNATTLYIEGPPTGITPTNPVTSLWVATGIVKFDGGILGTTTNDAATAGNIGEYITGTIASGSAVALTTTTTADVTSISLTAGDWDVTGVVDYAMASATATNFQLGISTTSATLGAQDTYVQKPFAFAGSSATLGDNAPTVRVSISGTTTVYLVAQATFSGGSIAAYGTIRARRLR